MGSKVSALTENTDPLLTDELYLVDDPAGTPVSKRLGLDTLLADGWLNPGETWVYVSATSFKVVGVDRTARYRTGRKLRCKQGGGYKYFYVASSAFTTDTTITTTGGSDYSLADAAIMDTYFSYADTPEGFPDWFAWAPTVTGYSSVPTNTSYRFKVSGRMCSLFIREAINGVSNANSISFSLPITAATVTNGSWVGGCFRIDNGAGASNPGMFVVASAGTVLNAYIDYAGNAWTASGGKRIGYGTIFYEI